MGVNEQQTAALVMARVARAMLRAAGMYSENQRRLQRGEAIAYDEHAFDGLVDSEGIGENAVISTLRG